MMRERVLMVLGLSAIAALPGCTPKINFHVQISPPGVKMSSVQIGDRRAAGSNGKYTAEVRFSGNQESRNVTVRAESRDGVVQEKDFLVSPGQDAHEIVNMPAEVYVKIDSPQLQNVTIKIDNDEVSRERGVYMKRILLQEPSRSIAVWARDEGTGLTDSDKVTVSAGERKTKTLHLVVAAKFRLDREPVRYEEEVVFDASESTPSESLVSYDWEFGDGTGDERTSVPRTKHTYKFNQSLGRDSPFIAKLTVATASGVTASWEKPVSVRIPDDSLVFALKVFPPKTSFVPGETVQLMLTPQTASFIEQVESLTLDFGDEHDKELTLECDDGSCKPILVKHVYDGVGRFELKMTYLNSLFDVTEYQPATLTPTQGSSNTIIVYEPYLSDDEMREKAWEDFYTQLDTVLKESGVQGKVLTLTSMNEANFELKDPDFVTVVDRLTKMLVEDKDAYFVLEKKSQVLARLAYEAVIDIRPAVEGGGIGSADSLEEQVYRKHLDYGLVTSHESLEEPIVYSIRIEGTADRLKEFETLGAGTRGKGEKKNPGRAISDRENTEDKSIRTTWLRNLPILMARFRTAEILIALDVLEDEVYETRALYKAQLKEAMINRTAVVEVHVRLLERSGRILRALDLTGEFENEVTESAFREHEAE